MKKTMKVLALVLAFVLCMALSAGVTVALLQDEDGAVNVMTVGNVHIDQMEYERAADGSLQDFTQNKPWIPVTVDPVLDGTQSWEKVTGTASNGQIYTAEGVLDKFVFVKNIGNTDAYLRTLVAIEAPERAAAYIGMNRNDTDYTWSDPIVTTIGGARYEIYVATYNGILAPEQVTNPSLMQLYLDKAATNEDVNLFGGEMDVLVLSQAVQAPGFASAAEGLEAAFGVITSDNHPWTGYGLWDGTADTSWYDPSATEYTLNSAAQVAGLAELVNGGNSFSGKTVKLAADINLQGSEWTPIGQTGGYYANTYFQGNFDGQGHTISGLTITKTNEGGNYAAGFFGFLDCGQSGIIKNIVFDGAAVNGHHWTGVAAGYLSGTMENVKVINSTVTCTHANDDACGDKAGAVVGYINGTQGTMKYCSAENCTVSAGRDAGQVVGCAPVSQVVSCTAANVTVTATGDCTDTSAGANINNRVIGREL